MAKEYRIILQPEAYAGMESAYEYLDEYSPNSAHKWVVDIMDAIDSLKTFPGRCSLARKMSSLFRRLGNFFTAKAEPCTASSSPYKTKRYLFYTFATVRKIA